MNPNPPLASGTKTSRKSLFFLNLNKEKAAFKFIPKFTLQHYLKFLYEHIMYIIYSLDMNNAKN